MAGSTARSSRLRSSLDDNLAGSRPSGNAIVPESHSNRGVLDQRQIGEPGSLAGAAQLEWLRLMRIPVVG